MIEPKEFFEWLNHHDVDFFTGVPDSLLKDFCAFVTDNVDNNKHVIAANEGNAVAIAAGYHLATGKIPLVYLQNSGMGNTVNPLLSLVDEKVYKIPILLLIGWRGEPNVHDEPQHISQGELTLPLLQTLRIPFTVLDDDSQIALQQVNNVLINLKSSGISHAIVVRKNTFEKYPLKTKIDFPYSMTREEALSIIVENTSTNDVFVSTTGKTSRELFECRAQKNLPHHSDFLTVGSMGHTSQIALGIALAKPDRRIFCLDGDGSVLMHMGGMAIIGQLKPANLIHIVINNGSHESVGGQPTAAFSIDLPAVALATGYKFACSITTKAELEKIIKNIKANICPALIEVRVMIGSRENLGRPTIKPENNKLEFMKFLGPTIKL